MNEPELPLFNTQSSHEIVKELAISDLLLLQRMRADNRKEWVERRKGGKWNDESLLRDTLIYTEKLHAAHMQAQLQLRLQLHDPIDLPALLTAAAAAASAAATAHHLSYRHSDDFRRFPRLDFGHALVLATLTASNKCVRFSFPLYRTPTYLPTSLPSCLPSTYLPTYLAAFM
jgi:predicted nucleic acid-binding protein